MNPVPGARTVLVVDDEARIRRFVGISLRTQGFRVLEAGSGASALDCALGSQVDMVILDLGLPDMDGREVLRRLRARSSVPVLVLSVRSGESEKVALLDGGANDYLTKPFGVAELLARVRALLRPPPVHAQPARFDDGELRVDVGSREVSRRGQVISLSRKEWALLDLLLREPGRVVTQVQLLRELWGPTHVEDTHYLRILAARLRGRLGDDAARPRYIATEPGVGLRFIGEPAPPS